ncbi:hypothetical protein Y1Q_0006783 [Alligator mississippiensis]|uniref:Uncharacterized protein n=1 Tax=Alligator mississippiensis TaxID=8496 RepID=A0A151MZ22_ALLMI|nr:hypothetical protein Y1Q_0006783 [Alligator mississippiensis]
MNDSLHQCFQTVCKLDSSLSTREIHPSADHLPSQFSWAKAAAHAGALQREDFIRRLASRERGQKFSSEPVDGSHANKVITAL